MLFDAIFVSLFVAGWLFCGLVPWLIVSIATHGHAGLVYLPLCLFTAVVAGLAVPILGATDSTGLWVSFAVALVAPSLLLAARRFSLGAAHERPVATKERR
jgi:hypothetical protein